MYKYKNEKEIIKYIFSKMSTLQFSNQMWHQCPWQHSFYKGSDVRCIYSNEALTESGGTQKFKVHHCILPSLF